MGNLILILVILGVFLVFGLKAAVVSAMVLISLPLIFCLGVIALVAFVFINIGKKKRS